MEPQILEQEKGHLLETLQKVQTAKATLEERMNVMGSDNLTRLQELREDPQTEPHDLLFFMEQLHEKNSAFNFKDKYKRLEEFESMLNEPYFSRIDLKEKDSGEIKSWYIGKFGYTEEQPVIVDWRAKIASVYYRYRYPQKDVSYDTPNGIETKDLLLKRTYEVDSGELIKYYNNDIQLDENEIIVDKIEKRTGGVLEDIVETIQEGQLDIIEADPRQVCIVQGSVGSGKSTVAIHKLSHIFFNFPELIHPERTILIAKNQILVGYLSTLFPKLGIFDVNYKTLRELIYSLVFREELGLKVDFDTKTDVSGFGLEQISLVKQRIDLVHDRYKKELSDTVTDPEFAGFGEGFIYNKKEPVSVNLSAIVDDVEEELKLQTSYLKENPNSIRSYTYKENIKVLKKLVNKLKKLRNKVKETTLLEITKEMDLPIYETMGYLDTLIYVLIYSELIGLEKTQRFEYCVVDEGQDFGVLEYLILGKLVLNGRFCILGDLNQAYAEEGIAAWNEIQSVISEAKNANTFELDTNYRSTKPIIDLANTVLSPYTQTFLPKSINRRGPQPKIILSQTQEDGLRDFKAELEDDAAYLNKSVGIIVYRPELYNRVSELISSVNVPEDKLIVLNSKKRVTYIPKGLYLSDFEDVKGLEFAKVYILGLDIQKINSFKEAKKAFVAVTRAMNELSIYSL